MQVIRSWQASLRLLSRRERFHFAVVVGFTMATAILDLLGVLLIGVVTVLAVSVVQGAPPPEPIPSLAQAVGLGGGDPTTLLVALSATAAALLILKSVVATALARRTLTILARSATSVTQRLVDRLLKQPLLFIQSRPTQDIVFALSAGTSAAVVTSLGLLSTTLAELCLLTILGFALIFLDPWVTLFAVLFFGLVGLLIHRFVGRQGASAGRQTADSERASLSAIHDTLVTYRDTAVSGRRDYFRDRIVAARRDSLTARADIEFVAMAPRFLFEIALVVGAAPLIASQFLLDKEPAAAFALLAIFLAASARVTPSLIRLVSSANSMKAAMGASAHTFKLASDMEDTHSPGDHPASSPSQTDVEEREEGSADCLGVKPVIELRGVSFRYPGAKDPAVDAISLSLEAGSSLALVGRSGAGKSTLADVILGVLEPTHGTALVGGYPPNLLPMLCPGVLACVPQDVALVRGTVRENVALGVRPTEVDEEQVWRAVRQSQLDQVLIDSRQGLDTQVGDRGLALSGGQKQRLGIARALYTRPSLLILDEATSSLDAETEHTVSETIRSLEGQVTIVTIAHRLATVRASSSVAYLEEGRLAALGSFNEVRAIVPAFDRQADLLGL